MTWQEYCLSRQLIAEERVGKAARAAIAAEDAAFAMSSEQLRRVK